jgi:hypothetical protein
MDRSEPSEQNNFICSSPNLVNTSRKNFSSIPAPKPLSGKLVLRDRPKSFSADYLNLVILIRNVYKKLSGILRNLSDSVFSHL